MFFYYMFVAMTLSLLGLPLLIPRKRRAGLGQKLGVIPQSLRRSGSSAAPSVWFHTVSVGEFKACEPLIELFQRRNPGYSIYLSTATQTAQVLAGQRLGPDARTFYFPLDLPWTINPWLDTIRPEAVVIAETEIWPGFTWECSRRDIPIMIVNGRLSKRSFRLYRQFRWLFGPVLRHFTAIACQCQEDAQRYRAIGGLDLPVSTTGNLKFDGLAAISQEAKAEIMECLGLKAGTPVVVAGSTHEKEETALLTAYRHLIENSSLENHPRLILAPRHPERFNRVEEAIRLAGFRPRRWSRQEQLTSSSDVYLLDTIGKLPSFYAVARIAFVGGTLVPIGGHNLLEPYIYAVPVVCGPYLNKTKNVANMLRARNALTVVDSQAAFNNALLKLVLSPDSRELGDRGRELILESQGAVDQTMRILEGVLASSRAGKMGRVAAAGQQSCLKGGGP